MGKSTSARFFEAEGARVLDTDVIARKLVEPGEPALSEIVQAFGDRILCMDGTLNRKLLAQLVFSCPDKRQVLERILHPRIRREWKSQVQHLSATGEPFVLVVIPLLFETVGEGEFQKVVCTACSPASQFSRLSQRGWSKEEIELRIASQLPTSQKMAGADFVIWTEGSLEVHGEQVRQIASQK